MTSSLLSQRSFDDLGTPLADTTFCVLDLETTGGDPGTCGITEVGAVKIRGGEVLGTFHTMVNPGVAIPPHITVITGITDQLVVRAPRVDTVLPSLLEFIGGSVIVGHNIRFDMAFIQAAMRRWGGPLLGNQRLDTLALARRLLVDEVPRFSLGELARRLRLPHQPTHRALDDALATVDLLHLLIERASAWGVTGLDDLVALPTIAGHPQWKKLSLTSPLPRKPGVYQFHDRSDAVLYVGKATDLRARVRSYFSSDRRRKVAQLLRETERISHIVCSNTLEAELLELRLIQTGQPRFNRRGRRPLKPSFVKLTTSERFPRLALVRAMKGPGIYLGPMGSRHDATAVIDAVQTALPLRRCSTRIGRRGPEPTAAPCTAAQLGVAMCPCSGTTTEAAYQDVVRRAGRAMTVEPSIVLDRLEDRMARLAEAERFEEAASVRNRAAAFVRAVARQRRLEMIGDIERLILETDNGARVELGPGGSIGGTEAATLDESLCVASWLDRNANTIRLVAADGALCSPVPGLPSYQPRGETEAAVSSRTGR